MKKSLILLSLSVPLLVAAQSSLSPWVGQYPSLKIKGKTARDVLLKSGALKKIAPPAELRLLDKLSVEDKVAQEGDYILVYRCMPHDCNGTHALVIEKNDGQLWLGIHQSTEATASTRWYGTAEYTDLPPGIQKKFLQGHQPD